MKRESACTVVERVGGLLHAERVAHAEAACLRALGMQKRIDYDTRDAEVGIEIATERKGNRERERFYLYRAIVESTQVAPRRKWASTKMMDFLC